MWSAFACGEVGLILTMPSELLVHIFAVYMFISIYDNMIFHSMFIIFCC